MTVHAAILLLTLASPALAQRGETTIEARAERAVSANDTPETARRHAVVDATRKALADSVARLLNTASVKALQLTPAQLEAYAAALLDGEREGAAAASRDVERVTVRVRFDPDLVAGRLRALHRDRDASRLVIDLWREMETLQRLLADQATRLARATATDASMMAAERQLTLLRLEARYLLVGVAAALARTEESAIGGRTIPIEGRERASRLARAALDLAPDLAEVRIAAADVLMHAGDPAAAEAEYRRALRLDPASSAGYVKLAEALRLQGSPDAVRALRRAIRLDPGSSRAHAELGFILRTQGSVAEALYHYDEAVRLDRDSIDAHNGLAVTLAGLGRLPEAVAEFREIVRIDPDYSVGYYNMATALADLDQDAEAAAALREVVRINPNHYNAHYNLGELFRLEEKFDESAKQFREYLRLVPATPQNQRNIQRAKNFIETFENP